MDIMAGAWGQFGPRRAVRTWSGEMKYSRVIGVDIVGWLEGRKDTEICLGCGFDCGRLGEGGLMKN
jgi:hypothetical protein